MATRVLLIEDEPILVSLYSTILSKEGYEVLNALDLETGEEKVIVVRPHVILLDLLIPKKTGSTEQDAQSFHEPMGFQILRLVKGTPSLKDTRVIVLSNLDSDEHVKTAQDLGADAYLVKANLDPHQLKQHVEQILQHTGPPQQLG